MNSLNGYIGAIETHGNLSLVTVNISGHQVKAIVMDTPETATYLAIGHSIQVLFKETEVVIGTEENPAISLQNKIGGYISCIENGALLSRLTVQTDMGEIVSVISMAAVEQLNLKENQLVNVMIKLNEVMLST